MAALLLDRTPNTIWSEPLTAVASACPPGIVRRNARPPVEVRAALVLEKRLFVKPHTRLGKLRRICCRTALRRGQL